MNLFPVPEKVLSQQVIEETIQDACRTTLLRWETRKNVTLRSFDTNDLPRLLRLLNVIHVSQEQMSRDFSSVYYGILSEDEEGNILATAIFYLAYSTWDSRCVYINHIYAIDTFIETIVMYTLADIAIKLDCRRLVWQHDLTKSSYFKALKAEMLEGWITLRMDIKAIDTFLSTKESLIPTCSESKGFDQEDVVQAIDDALLLTNTVLNQHGLKLHRATENNLDNIEAQVAALALYEREPESIHVNKEHYCIDGYKTDSPLFYCLLLQDTEINTFHGMGFFYFGYDVHKGRFLYLEDLFIDKSHRGRGGGSMVMYTLASICKQLSCTGFVWQALDWNTPAITFYQQIGAVVQNGLLTSRFAGAHLTAFIESRPKNC